jgi:hypothetical protein
MTLTELAESMRKAKALEQFIEESTRGMVDIQMKAYISQAGGIKFSGNPGSIRFDRAAVPAFDLQKIGDVDRFDTLISTVKYPGLASGNGISHGSWVGINYGSYGRSMTVLHDSEWPVYAHEFCHQLESWYGNTAASETGGPMPDVHALNEYHYVNDDGSIGGYSHTPPTWYGAYIGGTIKHFGGNSQYQPNPSEAEGVRWSWWRFTPTKPEGYDIALQPPIANGDTRKVMLSGTLSISSIVPIESAVITARSGEAVLDEQTVTAFDNPIREYMGVPEKRSAGFAVIIPKFSDPAGVRFSVTATAANGYVHTWENLAPALSASVKDQDIGGISLEAAPVQELPLLASESCFGGTLGSSAGLLSGNRLRRTTYQGRN